MNGLNVFRPAGHLIGILFAALLLPYCALAAEASSHPGAPQVLEQLQHPPQSCTQVPFWFWNGALDPKELKQQLHEMKDKGVYAAMPHPRFGMDRREYLKEPFWKAMSATLEEARKLHMQIWLYDEYNWPSGGAGGRVTDGHPELYPRALDYVRMSAKGPSTLALGTPTNTEPRMENFEKYLIAFTRPSGASDQSWRVWGKAAEEGRSMTGELAEGDWEILAFYQSFGHNPSPLDDGSNSMTDYLSEKSVHRFLSLTHEQYFRRFGKYFGNTIPAVFSDESSTTAPGPFPWTEDFVTAFGATRGGDLLSTLPDLVDASGASTRMAYWQTVAELYGGRHLGTYAAWARAHRLKLTGHVYEENIASYAHAPQLMNLLRNLDYPGFDALGPRCPPSGAKVAISAAHLEGREEALCESLGLAGGWNCTLDMLRRGYNTLGWLGVSRFVPHAFFQTVENPRVESSPSFFFQNPYWKYYRAIADLSARLSCFNRLGTHVAPCAVYYPIESLWADSVGGKGQRVLPWQHRNVGNAHAAQTIQVFNELVDQLAQARWDLDVVDDHALSGAKITKNLTEPRLQVGPESFRVLVVPPVSAIGASALKAIDRFAAEGGCVIWLERLPQYVWPLLAGEPSATISRWFPNGVPAPAQNASSTTARPIVLPANAAGVVRWLNEHLRQEIPVRGELDALRVNHRTLGSMELFLLFNDSDRFLEGTANLGPARNCSVVDLDSGRSFSGQFSDFGFKVNLKPGQSVAVIFGNTRPELPPWRVQRPEGEPSDFSRDWEIQLAGDALDREWRTTLNEVHVQLPLFRMQKRDFQKWSGWEQPQYDDHEWQKVHALRGNALSTDPTTLLFRAPLPPGAQAIDRPLPVTGAYAVWLNGRLVEKQLGPENKGGELRLAESVRGTGDVVALETISHSGPAGLQAPLSIRCGPAHLDQLRSWDDLGLGYYTGRVLYRKRFTLDAKPSALWLDLGQVQHYAEVYLNGKLAGSLLWAPYEIDLSSLCKAGENELTIVVANSIANRFAWDEWGTRGSATAERSGLIGPVRLWRK